VGKVADDAQYLLRIDFQFVPSQSHLQLKQSHKCSLSI